VKQAIVERFGAEVVGADGEIDRSKVASVVFSDRDELRWLEQLLHPRVISAYLRWREDLGTQPSPPAVCATEVPLLFEVGAQDRFDKVVVVTASPEVRSSRLFRPVVDRERRLLPDEAKLARADFAFVNDGSLEELDAFVSDVMAKLSEP
jgi:dephospho-CoA kinase